MKTLLLESKIESLEKRIRELEEEIAMLKLTINRNNPEEVKRYSYH